ncbi:aminoacyl-tRNA hydrolase [Candidatus Kaiserbacteria bacterium]|nr:aminoacyl-tRNA hydrolase [Candidatus Kaiserbacteria bacterium]
MSIVIMGLGNPGKEYEKTRHNAGRTAVALLATQEGFPDFVFNKKANALILEGKIGKAKAMLALPETMMNNSGRAASALVKSVRAARDLLIIRDDLDLPLGALKMTFARGSGGHKGVESVMRALKTDAFAQLKIGISGAGKRHQAKKVSGDEKVLNHVIGKWKPSEEAAAKKVFKKAAEAAKLFATLGLDAATQFANTR